MLPSYYDSVSESHERFNARDYPANPRYFRETRFHEYYTAGDAEQFQETIQTNLLQQTLQQPTENLQELQDSVWQGLQTAEKSPVSDLFSDITDPNVVTAETFDYIFHTISKGAYVEIRDNKLVTILPFRNMDFHRAKQTAVIESELGQDFPRKLIEILGEVDTNVSPKTPQKYSLDPAVWRLNGHMVRYENPVRHNVSKFHAIENMLETLLETREIPDCAFFLNNRDYPILREDGKEPNQFWFENQAVDFFPKKFTPVLGMTSMEGYADIAYPNWDDWGRVSALENRYFRKSGEKDYTLPELLPFDQRRDTIVFRGGSTGAGVTPETNPRIGAMKYNGWVVYSDAVIRPGETTPPELLDQTGVTVDVGLSTPLNRRVRKTKEGLGVIPEDINTGNSEYLSYSDQARCKYILNLDGHVSAFRLSMELASGCVIFLQSNSPYSMWYKPYLQPYVHYIPVDYHLADLPQQIQWCINNQEKCKEISQNAQEFYRVFLSKQGILDFWQTLLYRLVEKQGETRLILPIEAKLMSYASVARNPPSGSPVESPQVSLETLYRTFPQESYTTAAGLETVMPINAINLPPNHTRVTVSKHGYSDDPVAIVCKQRRQESWQTINENFIGRNIINGLLQITPGFAWTLFTNAPTDNTLMLGVRGESLTDLLLAGDIATGRKAIGMIAMTLVTGQLLNGLCMNKLHPNDVIIRRTLQREVSYVTPDGVYSITTDFIPTLVDYTYARGWTTDSITEGVYGYTSRYQPYYGLDMLSLAVNCVRVFLEQEPAADLDGLRQVFNGIIEIPENASRWAHTTNCNIHRWIYAMYMDNSRDVSVIIPGVDQSTEQLFSTAKNMAEFQKVEGVPRWNTNGLPVAVSGIIRKGYSGVREQFLTVYRCGFYVDSMLAKEYLKQLVIYNCDALVNTLRQSPTPELSSLAQSLDVELTTIKRSCFVGQYLLGKKLIPSDRELEFDPENPSKINRGPCYIDTILVSVSLEPDSPLKPIVDRYLSGLFQRNQAIATFSAMKWLE